MKRLKVAIPPGFDRGVVDIALRRRLRQATGDEYEMEYQVTFDHGGFALTDIWDSETGAKVDGAQEADVVKNLAPTMEFIDKSAPEGALSRLAVALKNERVQTEEEVNRIMNEMDAGKVSR